MSSLRQLDISDTAVTDKGVQKLARLYYLKALYASPRLTDAGMKHVGRLTRLEDLDLTGSRITNNGLAPLRKLRHLKELALSGTMVGDAGIKHIARYRTCAYWN